MSKDLQHCTFGGCRLLRWGSGTATNPAFAELSSLEQETRQPLLEDPAHAVSAEHTEPIRHAWPQPNVQQPGVQSPASLRNRDKDSAQQQLRHLGQQPQHQVAYASGPGVLTWSESEQEDHIHSSTKMISQESTSPATHPTPPQGAPNTDAESSFGDLSMQPAHRQVQTEALQRGIGRFRYQYTTGVTGVHDVTVAQGKQQASMPGEVDSTAAAQSSEGRLHDRLRQQRQSTATNANGMTQSKASRTPVAAGSLQSVQQQATAHQTPPQQQRHKLPLLMSHASNGGQTVLAEEQQVLRRRSSFRKVTGAVALHPDSLSAHSDFAKLAPACFTSLPPIQDDKLTGSSGSSLMQRRMSDTENPSNLVPAVHVDLVAGLHAGTPQQQKQQHGGAGQKKSAPRSNTCSRLAMHKALRQTIAQVRYCTLQLQEQQGEQRQAQQVLQAMNAEVAATLDHATSAVGQQQLHIQL